MNSNPFTTQTYYSELNELVASYQRKPGIKNQKITCSQDIYDLVKSVWPVDIGHREAMVALYLNRAMNTVGYSIISIGGVAATSCDPKIVFQLALLANASKVILIHNHPSGNIIPSQGDKNVTTLVKEAGKVLDIQLMDHLIITENDYFSFADNGQLF